MAPRKKKKGKRRSGKKGQGLLLLAVGVVLVLSVASIAVGVMNWMTRLYGDNVTDNLRIEILNGTGEKGLARAVARALMREKVDVLYIDNADRFDYAQTVLVARKRKPEIGSLGELLGCGRVVEQLTDDASIDATLIIGADYRTLNLGLEDESDLSE